MRNISTASLAKLSTKKGTEPVCIIEVQWTKNGPIKRYADKDIDGAEGRILSIDSFEDVINISKNGTSQSVSVTLSDVDGELKKIFNQNDLHKKKVWMYQWFTGIPLSDKILLFLGVIASPVIWKESDRTLSFSIISQANDIEVGFSPEEGYFPTLPQGLIGTTWPLVFGRVSKLPGILVDTIAHKDDENTGDGAASVTEDGTGIEDPSLDHQLKDKDENLGNLYELARLYFIGALLAINTAEIRGEKDYLQDYKTAKGYFSDLAKQYVKLGNDALKKAQTIKVKTTELTQVKTEQKKNQKDSIRVTNGDNFPQGQSMKLNLNGGIHTGYFLGNQFVITDRQHPSFEQFEGFTVPPINSVDRLDGDPVINRQNYFFADSGIPLKYSYSLQDLNPDGESITPVRYIISATLGVTVFAVYAYRTVNEIRSLCQVPYNLYSSFTVSFGSLPVTIVLFNQPLSSRVLPNGETEGWDDDIWVSCQSSVGPNTVVILKWLIQTYTGKTWDPTTFNQVQSYVSSYPMNFALTDRPNVLDLISDIAYQARCIVWLKNDVFYIKYLPKADTPVMTLTEADILEQTMEVTYTETEDLVTKYVAKWRADYKHSKNFSVILRYNIKFYGLHSKEYNYFCFNFVSLVQKAATFWLIREANTFKRIKFKVPIKFLKLETLDTVTLNFSHDYIANVPVNCVVEEAKLDTGDYTIDLTLWCPVRAGEMVPYAFAYPSDLAIQFIFPTEKDIQTGRAGSGGDVPQNTDVRLPTPTSPNDPMSRPLSGDGGNGGSVQTNDRPRTWSEDTGNQYEPNNLPPEIIQRLANPGIYTGTGKKPDGTTKYQYNKSNPDKAFDKPPMYPRTFPGKVVGEKTGESDAGKALYNLFVYQDGFGKEGKTVENVAFIGDPNKTIKDGAFIFLHEVFTYDEEDSDKIITEKYFSVGESGSPIYPGYVQSGDSEVGYTVKAYKNGLDNDHEMISGVEILQISDEDDSIPVDTAVFIVEMDTTDPETEEPVTKFYMQPPVWQ